MPVEFEKVEDKRLKNYMGPRSLSVGPEKSGDWEQ
jgi:hypothetical protein